MAKAKRPKDPASAEAERQAEVIHRSGHPTHGVRRKIREQQRPLEPKR